MRVLHGMRRPANWLQLVRFAIVGGVGFVINILHDPAAGPVPTYLSKGGSAWNGKLVYSFGPGAKAGYHQGRNFGGLNGGLANIEETAVGAMDARGSILLIRRARCC